MRNQSKSRKVRLGISIGDINGIGLEVIMKAFSDNRIFDLSTPVVYASSKYVIAYQKAIGMKNFSFNFVKPNANIISKRANLINCWDGDVPLALGKETAEGGVYALKSLSAAVEALKEGQVDALVTAPINKHNIQSDEFNFPGHTEYLANEFDGGDALMFMVADSLRIGVVSFRFLQANQQPFLAKSQDCLYPPKFVSIFLRKAFDLIVLLGSTLRDLLIG